MSGRCGSRPSRGRSSPASRPRSGRGFRHRDWSAFGRHEFPENDGDIDEWASRTGRYSWLGDMEDRLLHDDDHLR